MDNDVFAKALANHGRVSSAAVTSNKRTKYSSYSSRSDHPLPSANALRRYAGTTVGVRSEEFDLPESKRPPPRVLVIVPAGPTSLHPTWELSPSIDLVVLWYASSSPGEAFTKDAIATVQKRGPKWQLVRSALGTSGPCPGWRDKYDYVWLPDDDLRIETGSIETLARTMRAYGFELAQPCLTDLNITSASYRTLQLRHSPTSCCKRTNFCEIMAPMFSVRALDMVFAETIDTDSVQSGWGLDSVWPVLLSKRLSSSPSPIGVIDRVRIEHTRPPNAFRNTSVEAYQAGVKDPQLESLELLGKYKIHPYDKRVFQVILVEDRVSDARVSSSDSDATGRLQSHKQSAARNELGELDTPKPSEAREDTDASKASAGTNA